MQHNELSYEETVALLKAAIKNLPAGAHRLHILASWEMDDNLYAEIVISSYGNNRLTQWWRVHVTGPKMTTHLVCTPIN